jgi:hypothetical protein
MVEWVSVSWRIGGCQADLRSGSAFESAFESALGCLWIALASLFGVFWADCRGCLQGLTWVRLDGLAPPDYLFGPISLASDLGGAGGDFGRLGFRS